MAVAAALAVLLRVDGLTLVVALNLAYLSTWRRLPSWQTVATFFALIMPWFAFSWAYFGTLVPNSMHAKQTYVQQMGYGPWAMRYFFWPYTESAGLERLVRIPLATLGLLLGLRTLLERKLSMAAAVLWVLIYLIAYDLASVGFAEWYIMPLIPVMVLLAMYALQWLVSQTFPRVRFPAWSVRAAPLGMAVLLLMVGVAGWVPLERAMRFYRGDLDRAHLRVGEWLKRNASPQATVMTGDIGLIGWIVPNFIIDASGLVTKAEGHLVNDVSAFQPTYFVHHDVPPHLAEEGFWGKEGENYLLVYRTPINAATGFYKVFQRRDSLDQAAEAEARSQAVPQGPLSARPEPQFPVKAVFGSKIELVGYDVELVTDEERVFLVLVSYFQALAPLEDEYILSYQFADDRNKMVFKDDRGMIMAYPSQQWKPGEYVGESRVIEVPAQARGKRLEFRAAIWVPRISGFLMPVSLKDKVFLAQVMLL